MIKSERPELTVMKVSPEAHRAIKFGAVIYSVTQREFIDKMLHYFYTNNDAEMKQKETERIEEMDEIRRELGLDPILASRDR